MIIETCEKWINKNHKFFCSPPEQSRSVHTKKSLINFIFAFVSTQSDHHPRHESVCSMMNENIYLIDKNESFRRLNYILHNFGSRRENSMRKKWGIFLSDLTWWLARRGLDFERCRAGVDEWKPSNLHFLVGLHASLLFSLSLLPRVTSWVERWGKVGSNNSRQNEWKNFTFCCKNIREKI